MRTANTITACTLTAVLALSASCKMENPFLTESPLPYGAPQFDKIENKHYLPAFEQGIAEGKAEIDAIVANEAEPTFENTIEALERSGKTLNKVSNIFYNLLEADSDDEMQEIAEKVSPMMTEYSMYSSLNAELFGKVKSVYDKRESLDLETDQRRLLDNTYKAFVRGGAALSDADKASYSKLCEELSLAQLEFGRRLLASTNAYTLNITDSAKVAELPQFVRTAAAELAEEKGQQGWTFDLSQPSYSAFMKYSSDSGLKKQLYIAYGSRGFGGEYDNSEVCRKIAELRIRIANLLGYPTYADYALEDRMAGSVAGVEEFLTKLTVPALPVAKAEVAELLSYARANGYQGEAMENWDFSYWSEKLKNEKFALGDEQLKPYFQLEKCIDAVLGLATRLYGITFEERTDIPGYNKDVKVFDVKDTDGSHLALFYADFFPRASKRNGAWMTSFQNASTVDGVETRPFISIVTNFTKPTADSPSLLTPYELETFLHEFGHALHGILGRTRYESMGGTGVNHDFVELPSQIMENWCYEPEYLNTFAFHYKTGELIPSDYVRSIVDAQNYHSGYAHVRQLQYGTLDMAWHTLTALPEESTADFEKKVLSGLQMMPPVAECCSSTAFSHIFSGGYAAGYYSYKWAEVLAADAFSLFAETGIFNKGTATSFRDNILSKGSNEDEGELYRRFRGHDPESEALLRKLGIIE